MTNNKQKLFKVMHKINPDFKPKLNEEVLTTSKNKIINETNIINPKYNYFAIMKDSSEIVNGWEYNDINSYELRKFSNDYFFSDLKDMGIDPNSVRIVSSKYLQSSGINPFDVNNWKQVGN